MSCHKVRDKRRKKKDYVQDRSMRIWAMHDVHTIMDPWKNAERQEMPVLSTRAGKIFSVPLATMEPLPKNQSPNWNQDLKPGRQSRTPKRTVAKRCEKNTRTGTLRLSETCKTLCTHCTSKVFAEKLENKKSVHSFKAALRNHLKLI